MKTFKVYFNNEDILAQDESGVYAVAPETVKCYEPNYKTDFTRHEIYEYLDTVSNTGNVNINFAESFIKYFCIEQ